VHPLEKVKVVLLDDQVAPISTIRTHSTGVPRQRLEHLEEILAIADGLMPMSDVIRASAPQHVVEASSENSNLACAAALIIAIDWPTSNSAFAAALIIAIDWQGVSFACDHYCSWHVIIGGAPNANLYRLRSGEEFAAEAAAFTPVSGIIAGDSKCNKELCSRLKKKYAVAVRRRDAGDAPSLEDFEAISDATYKERDEGLVQILTLGVVSALYGKTSWRADVRFIVRQGPKLRPCENCKASFKN
jgi:hypothetical protein